MSERLFENVSNEVLSPQESSRMEAIKELVDNYAQFLKDIDRDIGDMPDDYILDMFADLVVELKRSLEERGLTNGEQDWEDLTKYFVTECRIEKVAFLPTEPLFLSLMLWLGS